MGRSIVFNDDDIYVYEAATLRLVRSVGPSSADARALLADPGPGLASARGLRAKYLGLWQP